MTAGACRGLSGTATAPGHLGGQRFLCPAPVHRLAGVYLPKHFTARDRAAAGALDGLRHEPGPGPAAIADLMAKLPAPRR